MPPRHLPARKSHRASVIRGAVRNSAISDAARQVVAASPAEVADKAAVRAAEVVMISAVRIKAGAGLNHPRNRARHSQPIRPSAACGNGFPADNKIVTAGRRDDSGAFWGLLIFRELITLTSHVTHPHSSWQSADRHQSSR